MFEKHIQEIFLSSYYVPDIGLSAENLEVDKHDRCWSLQS